SWTNQRFRELNFGETFPFRYDRRHNLTFAGRHELGDRWTMSGTFTYLSGARYTLPTGRLYSAQGGDLYAGLFYDYERLNNYTLRPTHRLDLSATYRLRPRRVRRSELVFGLYNAYSRLNPYYVYLDLDLNTGEPIGKEVALLPVIPSISYNVWF
ncbi:MAG: TonB-dependent receptor, partial [Rhodothermales bacterium]|nr:TonB-dependent receptor [Rhodothermales bacterium]